MMNYLISKFIDEELSFDDKVIFVETVHKDEAFREETIELLHQEKLIRSEVVDRLPALRFKAKSKLFTAAFRPLSLLIPAAATAIIVLFYFVYTPQNPLLSQRFVIYRPDVTNAEITGTFTGWKKVPMRRIGSSGYWDITMNLPEGEHRFIYILNGKQRFADPTVMSREHDDFGGENSIISVESKT
jgi:hypothetical protein